MGIIDINVDDRDTINCEVCELPPEPPELIDPILTKYKEWLGILKGENLTARINNLGEGRFKIDIPVIGCTGSDVETHLNIPFMHIFEKMETKHTDNVQADSNDALTYAISHRHHPNLWLVFLAITSSISSDIVDEFVNYRHEKGEYKLITNSTNTDLLYIACYIKVTGD
jgi:hypothetical protein